MIAFFITFIILAVSIVAIGLGGITVKGALASNHHDKKMLSNPKSAAKAVAQLYKEDNIDEIENILNHHAKDWNEKSWQIFHKQRNKELDTLRTSESTVKKEIDFLQELKASDKRQEKIIEELKDPQNKWDDEFKKQ